MKSLIGAPGQVKRRYVESARALFKSLRSEMALHQLFETVALQPARPAAAPSQKRLCYSGNSGAVPDVAAAHAGEHLYDLTCRNARGVQGGNNRTRARPGYGAVVDAQLFDPKHESCMSEEPEVAGGENYADTTGSWWSIKQVACVGLRV